MNFPPPFWPAAAAEFPNDNPALHDGATWVCLEIGRPIRAVVRPATKRTAMAIPQPAPAPALDAVLGAATESDAEVAQVGDIDAGWPESVAAILELWLTSEAASTPRASTDFPALVLEATGPETPPALALDAARDAAAVATMFDAASAESAPAVADDAPSSDTAPVVADDAPSGDTAPVIADDAPSGDTAPVVADDAPSSDTAAAVALDTARVDVEDEIWPALGDAPAALVHGGSEPSLGRESAPEVSVGDVDESQYEGEAKDPSAALTAFIDALVGAALAAGSTRAAAVIPMLVGEGRIDAALLDDKMSESLRASGIAESRGSSLHVTGSARATLDAWRDVLQDRCSDLSACGTSTLDVWGAELLVALGVAPSCPEVRRELRRRGVAAFGMLLAA